jgi:hypothetical protein
MSSQNHLDRLVLQNKEREIRKLETIEDASKRPFHILSLVGINEIFFLHKAFVDQDMQTSKIFLYKIAMTNAYYHEQVKGEIFEVLKVFTYPLLSDSQTAINRYLNYSRTSYADSYSAYFGKAIQSVLKDDNVALQSNIEGLRKWSTKGWAKQYAGIVRTFDGFLYKDKAMIEQGLQEIVDLHDKQEQPALVGDYINLEASALAKLAWRKGFKAEVKSKLIPRELLPVKELPTYEGYQFFEALGI